MDKYAAYLGMYRYLDAIGATPDDEKMYDQASFTHAAAYVDYIRVAATGRAPASERLAAVLVLNPRAASETSEFRKLTKAVGDVQRLIVFSNELFPPNLKKICASLEAGGTRLTNRTFEFVKHLSNDHALVPLHVVMSDEERDLVLSQERTGLENFPILRMGDIQRELIDARPGQMVKIYRATENGYVLTYAVVTA